MRWFDKATAASSEAWEVFALKIAVRSGSEVESDKATEGIFGCLSTQIKAMKQIFEVPFPYLCAAELDRNELKRLT